MSDRVINDCLVAIALELLVGFVRFDNEARKWRHVGWRRVLLSMWKIHARICHSS